MASIGQMMKQMQELQSRMQEMQAEMERMEIEGSAGGGLVTVRLNGKGAMTGLSIDGSLMREDEREILEDLIVAAHNDAKTKTEQEMAERMKALTGGLALPPGLNLGF